MIRYCIRKFCDYYIEKIDEDLEKEAIKILNDEELRIYFNMDYYDRWHGLLVYSRMKKVTTDRNYLIFSILHDCGKKRASFLLRIIHKLGFVTRLKNHPKIGYDMLEKINKDVAILILHHHDKNTNGMLKVFQDIDDRS